jgi:hypothetical protein
MSDPILYTLDKQHPNKKKRGWSLSPEAVLAIGGMMIFLICAVAYFGYHLYGRHSAAGIVPAGDSVFIISNGSYPQPVISVNTATGATEPVTVPGQGNSLVIDLSQNGGTTTPYYLIADPQLTNSNLYAGNVKNPKAGLSQVTHSDAMKYDLSYDYLSGVAAYMENASSTTHVLIYSPVTKAETDLGAGSDPSLLPGGFFVIERQGGEIVSVNISTGTVYPLASLTTSSPFAVDAGAENLALYNAQTQTIQYFNIQSKVSASYVSSSAKLASAPTSLVYVNHKLLGSYNSYVGKGTNAKPQIVLQYVGGESQSITFTTQAPPPLAGYHLSSQH